MVDDKGDALSDGICPIHDLLVERDKIRLIVEFEFDRIASIPFVSSAVIVGSEEFGEIHYLSW